MRGASQILEWGGPEKSTSGRTRHPVASPRPYSFHKNPRCSRNWACRFGGTFS